MINGANANSGHKADLVFGANSDGAGDISQLQATGYHKMSETTFNELQFTEVLAVCTVEGVNYWVACTKTSNGGVWTADEVFEAGHTKSFTNGAKCFSSRDPNDERTVSQFNANGVDWRNDHGPIFGDVWGGYGWMWNALSNDWKGTPTSEPTGAVTMMAVWTWYGRTEPTVPTTTMEATTAGMGTR